MTLFRLQSVVCPHSTPEPTKSNQNKGNQLNKCNNISLNVLEFVKDKLAVFYLLFNKQVFVILQDTFDVSVPIFWILVDQLIYWFMTI